jgi:hypothetical protein
MTSFVVNDDAATSEEDEMNDEDATLADDLLDEVGSEADAGEADEMEGFGHLSDDAVKEDEKEEPEKTDEDTAPLEDDAGEVDYDKFDDVDEL